MGRVRGAVNARALSLARKAVDSLSICTKKLSLWTQFKYIIIEWIFDWLNGFYMRRRPCVTSCTVLLFGSGVVGPGQCRSGFF